MTKKKKSGLVSVEEMLEMKIMEASGKNKTEIAKATGRHWQTVDRNLKDFEVALVGNEELQYKLDDQLKDLTETIAENASALVIGGQHQTARALPDATAMEAAKITQININILNGLKNLSGKGFGDEVGTSPVVNNFIQNVINITTKEKENVRPGATPTTERRFEENDKRGAETVIEGVVQK